MHILPTRLAPFYAQADAHLLNLLSLNAEARNVRFYLASEPCFLVKSSYEEQNLQQQQKIQPAPLVFTNKISNQLIVFVTNNKENT